MSYGHNPVLLRAYVVNLGLDSAKFSRGLCRKPKKAMQVARKQLRRAGVAAAMGAAISAAALPVRVTSNRAAKSARAAR